MRHRRPKGPETDRPSLNHRGRVGRGGCPPRPPTDPGVPNSGTRLFRPRLRPWPGGHGPEALSAVVLLRWSQGSESLASIPPTVSWPGAPFPRRGPSGRFPRVTGSTRRSDSPPPVPPRFVAFAPAVSRSHPRFGPVAAGCAGREPGVGHPVPPAGAYREGVGASQVPGGPVCERALFSDPGGTACARPLRRRGAAFHHVNDVGSRTVIHFGAQSHGLFTHCLRFAAPVARTPRKTGMGSR